jgi:hypothetical protein
MEEVMDKIDVAYGWIRGDPIEAILPEEGD